MISAPVLDSRFRLSEPLAQELAASYGTPLYVIDEAHFRGRIRQYLTAFRQAWPRSETSFASKANSTLALLAIANQEGCQIDVASEGELRAALRAGVPAARCHFHGNNKQRSELEFALSQGIGTVVVDHFGEIEMLADLDRGDTKFVIRLAPGVDPLTHAKISTGQADTKFGFNIADGAAEEATRRALAAGLQLTGYHCHVGSQLLDPEAQRSGGELIARFAVEMRERHGFETQYLNVGGGLGVKYTDADEPMGIDEYNRLIVDAFKSALQGTGLDPVLGQEPGRSLIGESGVTLYRVGVVKTVPAKERDTRTYVCVDGGLSDNPRPVMYGSQYTVESFGPGGTPKTVTVSGKHCETDKLFEDVVLPSDIQPGALLQVLTTGAYNASMSSNYNRYPRPATALIREDGTHVLVQRRDSWDEMFAREHVPGDLTG
jgi:diaminopimelate decarboxylase